MPEDRAHSGPPDARAVFEILVREHADMLGAFLRALIGPDPAADDLFQETMLVAWRKLGEYDRSRPFAPWLRGIAQMLVMAHHRRTRRRPMATDPAVLAEIDRRFDALLSVPGDTFGQRVGKLWDCVGTLPEAMRDAIEHVYMRRIPIAAAAEALDSNRETLWKRVQRARRLLADCLGIGEVPP